ncbi:MAG: hypothetical protein K2Q13_01355 [Nitrosomonas sp.]|uniref:hypothetical protein n=1 Tax=Nitrosomonas sp. TaxID=42353 RepID=UPI0025D10668|nr:hypothetical protein [Nitrosomonas sp.]MBY0473690.1 hypothetical protein [Nitrosomonas sp.]
MTYILLLDQIFPFLESQFSALPIDLQNRLTQKGIEKPNIDISANVSKWDKLSKLQREYLAALYDFHYSPNHREKAASEKLIESIAPYLGKKFSDLPQQMKMNIAYVDIFQKWDEISTEQRKQMARDFDASLQPDYEKTVNQYCDWELERQSIPDQIFNWQRLNPNGIASEQIIIDTKIKELEEREIELKELLGYSNSNNEQELKQAESILVTPHISVARVNKLRRNILDPAIEEAIKKAGTTELADVFLQLKELAKDECPPFTGIFEGDALCYTNENDIQAKLSRSALGKRLKRRQMPLNTVY